MKIAVISDVHLEFREKGYGPIPDGTIFIYGEMSVPATIDADVIVVAGDVHPYDFVRERFYEDLNRIYQLPVIHVDGNHDFYGSGFPAFEPVRVVTIGGVTFAIATMWTSYTPMDALYTMRMNDFRLIRGAFDFWNETNASQVKGLIEAKADVVVTHHAPFPKSVHPRWRGHALNAFFVNDLDPGDFPETRLWIHGHVHDGFDYVEGNIRVVCNPHGYPHECASGVITPKIVTI